MKIKFALVTGLVLLSAMVAGADNITIHATRQPAEEVFRQIARQSGKNFVYATDLLRGRIVTVSADNAALETVLGQMLKSTGIKYSIKGNNIILSREKNSTAVAKVTVSGFVREKGNGEPMVGALVRCGVGEGTVVTATNTMGFYSLTLPAGKHPIMASYLGYEPVSRTVDIHGNQAIDFDMIPSSKVLHEVEVEGSRNRQQAISSPSIGSINVGKAAIASTPVLFGESDVIKTLQLEPGVSAGVEGMAGMYVHGGNTDENMYMLDNIPLYQVNHLGGLFSAFNVEALRNVDFYKSSFPARYDGRLSSYMEVNTKDGSLESHHGSARLGLTSGAFNIDGPIGHRGTSYSVAL
ncbi:MAG: secretin and TonB N-terminal domain-containing protein, partial [Muribaculaceae bacterium]|nr:secretin and TonB N-terminal domain-containing protein [Muribaculaceae bacterium]